MQYILEDTIDTLLPFQVNGKLVNKNVIITMQMSSDTLSEDNLIASTATVREKLRQAIHDKSLESAFGAANVTVDSLTKLIYDSMENPVNVVIKEASYVAKYGTFSSGGGGEEERAAVKQILTQEAGKTEPATQHLLWEEVKGLSNSIAGVL